MLDINSWDFRCGDVLWEALKSTGIRHSFIQDKYVEESAGVHSGFQRVPWSGPQEGAGRGSHRWSRYTITSAWNAAE